VFESLVTHTNKEDANGPLARSQRANVTAATIELMILRLCAVIGITICCLLPATTSTLAATADARVPFAVGETLTYDVSWSNFLTAGRATMRVTDRKPLGGGRSGYGLQVEAQSVSVAATLYKLYYKVQSVLETSTLASVQSAGYSKEGSRERVNSISFGPNNSADVEIRTKSSIRRKLALPPHTLDMLSAIYVIRALAVKPGESLAMPIVDGDTVSRVRLTFGNREMVTTGLGRLPGWKVTPVLLDDRGQPTGGRALTFWLSDDAARKPLRFEAALPVGSITLTLAK
jgi:hypothetical protein